MPSQFEFPITDYLFAGAGASATLLLMSMERQGMLKGKKIVIVDPDSKTVNDKTYCFWGDEDKWPALQCQHLISHQWGKVSVNQQKAESLSPLNYFHLSSIDLYIELQRIIQTYEINRIHSSVISMETHESGVLVKTEKENWCSQIVFDSRPPKYLPPQKNEMHLLQSFFGFVIETEVALKDSDCIDLMDFEVEQQGWSQFVYVLPFSRNKMLVELTRFGQDFLTQAEAEPLLYEYISKRFGKFKILETETGCIPMSSAKIIQHNVPGVVALGGRAGAVKPSTGYAFKNMFEHAEVITNCLQKGKQPTEIKGRSRFEFYDRLLLLVLGRQPDQGKPIFQALFKKNKTLDVLIFLEEKTSFVQDLRILITLPIMPFLKALKVDMFARYRHLFMPIFLLFLASSMLILFKATPNIFYWLEYLFFFIGLFCVGIPHGAVDYLTETGNFHSKINFKFILRYLSKTICYFVFWLLLPNAAFLLFIIYSVWHFGQCDINEWNTRYKSPLIIWSWGSLLLAIILFGHIVETNLILGNLNIPIIKLTDIEGKITSLIFICFAIFWGLWERKAVILISCCMLAISIQLPLITSFALYFIGQHSINGWSYLKQKLHTNDLPLFMKAIPFTIGAFILFGTLLYFMQTGLLDEFNKHWQTAFFVFISCISFPHVIAMHKFYKIETN